MERITLSDNYIDFRDISDDKFIQKYSGKIIDISSHGQEIRIWPAENEFGTVALIKIPVKFGTINRNFNCSKSGLFTLENCPERLHHTATFYCSENHLRNLKYGPTEIVGYFARNNKISSFEGFPSIVYERFDLSKNKIRSLTNIHNYLKHCRILDLSSNPIEGGILGVFLIGGLRSVIYNDDIPFDNPYMLLGREEHSPQHRAFDIVNKYLFKALGKKSLLACQQELIDNNLEIFAEL